MSISLNNHESRITALENKSNTTGGIIETKMTNPGYVKFSNGILIQFGDVNNGNNSFKTAFKSMVKMAVSGEWSYYGDNIVNSVSLTGFNARIEFTNYLRNYIAIGILYTYRYIIKSAQKFTPLSYLFNKEV